MSGLAQIIPFPPRSRPAVSSDRLATALTDLAASLAAQRQAVAAWRSALTDLGFEIRANETSLLRHLGSLGVLHEGIARLHENARMLESWGNRQPAATPPAGGVACTLAALPALGEERGDTGR